MKFGSQYLVEKVTSDEPARYALHHVHLDVERKSLCATNGKALVSIPVEPEEGDVSGLLSVDAVKAARKIAGKRGEPCIKANGAAVLDDGSSHPRPEGMFPDVSTFLKGAPAWGVQLTIDPTLLLALAKAMGGEGHNVTLRFQVHRPENGNGERFVVAKQAPIHASIPGQPDVTGIIMPIVKVE